METWLKRGAAFAVLAVVLGCGGGSKQFSPAAVPIAVKLREALKTTNNSDIAGTIEQARKLFETGAITEADLKRFVLIKNLGDGNSWDDAKKILEEGLVGTQ
jgi:hypothetical protein